MTWREPKRLVSAVVFTALILAGPCLHHNKVICIQSDSHIQVERVGADCCLKEATEVASESFSASYSDEDCGSCVDIKFSQDAARLAQCVQAAQSISVAAGKNLDCSLHRCIELGGQVYREAIPLYPLTCHSYFNFYLSAVIRC